MRYALIRCIVFFFAFIISMAMCWYGGMEITERSSGNAIALGCCVVFSLVVSLIDKIEP